MRLTTWSAVRSSYAVIGKFGPTPAARRARSACASAGDAARTARLRAPDACFARRSDRAAGRLAHARGASLDLVAAAAEQLSRSFITSFVCLRPRFEQSRWRVPCASADVMRPRSTASLQRLLDALAGEHHHLHRDDQVLAKRLAELGDGLGLDARRCSRGVAAVRAVVFAALRAFCWRPRACPPFFAAAVRFVAELELDALLRLLDDAADERLLAERCSWRGSSPTWRGSSPSCSSLALDDSTASTHHFDLPAPLLRRSAIRAPPPVPRRLDCSRNAGLSHLGASGDPTSHRATTGAWSDSRRRRPSGSRQLALLRRELPRRLRRPRARGRAGGRWRSVPVGSPRPNRSRSSANAAGCAAGPQVQCRRRRRADRRPTTRPRSAAAASSSAARLLRVARPTRGGSRSIRSRRPRAPRAPTSSSGARAAASASTSRCSRIRPGSRTSSWFEPPSHDAIRSGLTFAASRCSGRHHVARREPAHARSRRVRSPRRAEPERRRLLEQRHVPLVVGEPAGELVAIAAGSPARASRCARSRAAGASGG